MTQDVRSRIAELIITVFMSYGKQINQPLAKMWVDDLSEFSYEQIHTTLSTWRKKSSFAPTIADILKILKPEINEKDDALEVASLIMRAIKNFGYMRQLDAKEWMGEIAWQTVCGYGGWQMLCSSVTEENISFYTAQLRDLAQSIIRRDKAGVLNDRPMLSGNSSVDGVAMIEDARKKQPELS